jgi:hypothetical protein
MARTKAPEWYIPDEEITPELALKFQEYLARSGKVVADNWGRVCSCGYFRPQMKGCLLGCEQDVCQRWECNRQRIKPGLFCSKECEERYSEYWKGGTKFLSQLEKVSKPRRESDHASRGRMSEGWLDSDCDSYY